MVEVTQLFLQCSAYVLAKHTQLWNWDSLSYGMEPGWCTLHCMQALFRAVTIAGVVVRGFRSSSVPVTHESYLFESRRPLWFGSHKPIALSLTTLSRHSPLATASRSTSMISLCLGSSASLSSPFSSPCYVGSHCSAFLFCLDC